MPIGAHRIRFTVHPDVGESRARLALALGQPNAINSQDADGDGQLDGFDAAIPTVQILAELDHSSVRIGGWFHYAVDRLTIKGEDEDISAFVVGGHVRIYIQGEGFLGENATDVLGGIGQGLVPDPKDAGAKPRALATVGGWAEVGVQVTPSYKVVVGGTVDSPDEDDLEGMTEARTQNSVIYLVQHFTPLERVRF